MDESQDNCRFDARHVTADSDSLILVDAADLRVGSLSKARCHQGSGVLHRAFSVLLFNGSGELLIQQRALSKRLWPAYWSNSCCSHPRSGESMEGATQRRLHEELGVTCPLQFLYKFQYHAQFDADGAENELCSVFIGHSGAPIRVDSHEVMAWRWISPDALHRELAEHGARRFTPWFMMEWERIWGEHRETVLGL